MDWCRRSDSNPNPLEGVHIGTWRERIRVASPGLAGIHSVGEFVSAQSMAREGQWIGAGGRTRTDTLSPVLDFESSASTNFATPALE